MTVINGYRIIGELKNDNSGYAKWGFAEKNGVQVFIKEFLSPIYPLDGTVLSRDQIISKREICHQFEQQKRHFYNQLNQCSTGNIVTVLDFFREGSKYYMITEKVDATPIEPREISMLSIDKKILIMKIILHCVNTLHQHGIVHGDIKPDNILLKRTQKGFYTAKIIDFDSSFLESNPPECDEDFQGDTVYLAPESFLFIAEEEGNLTRKLDVFALGILFHQYMCGDLPYFDVTSYDYAFEAILDGAGVTINNAIPEYIRHILERMLDKDPEKRPDIDEIFSALSGNHMPDVSVHTTTPSDVSVDYAAVESAPAGGAYYTGGLKSTMRTSSAPSAEYVPTTPPPAAPATPARTDEGYFKKADDLW